MRVTMGFWLVLGLAWAVPGEAQQYIYPNQGQTPEQMNQDRYECHTWAVQQTGYDPSNPGASQSSAPPPSSGGGGEVIGGAARGAAVGAVVGAITGDAGEGAAAGAAGGAVVGLFRRHDRRRQEHAEQQYYDQQAQASASQQANYNNALAVCMQGRGYTVN